MSEPRSFSAIQRIELFSRSNGYCQSCHAPITLTDFHADHVIPWSKGGKTTLANGQALCRPCNLNKSATMEIPYQMHLPAGWTLRAWQEEFVNRYLSSAIQQINKPPSEINAFILHASLAGFFYRCIMSFLSALFPAFHHTQFSKLQAFCDL